MRGLWRTEQALAVLANMLLGELAKEKGSVGVQDESGRKQHGASWKIQKINKGI